MRLSLWVAATRPPFLSVTAVGVFLGLACALHDQTFRSLPLAIITFFFAILAQAGANVVNDYYDAISGCDAVNDDRISPFTGGSRFIQNGLLSEKQTRRFGYALLGLVIPAGLWLINQSGGSLLWIGLAGLFSAWAYSATPFKLQSRGLGELTIILAWLMVVIGSDYVQSQSLSLTALYAGLAYAPLVANVLFVNQIPDRTADASVGKHTLIVRYGTTFAPWGSLILYSIAYAVLLTGIAQQQIPGWAALSLLSLIPASISIKALLTDPSNLEKLATAIPLTILSCLLFGLFLTTSLIFGSQSI